MIISKHAAPKIVHHLTLAARQLQQFISDPANYKPLCELLNQAKTDYAGPINSWVLGWIYWITRVRVGTLDAVKDAVDNTHYNEEKIVMGMQGIFSEGEWKSTSLNTYLLKLLIKELVKAEGYDHEEILSDDNKKEFTTLFLEALQERLSVIRRHRNEKSEWAQKLEQHFMPKIKLWGELEQERRLQEKDREQRFDDLKKVFELVDKEEREARKKSLRKLYRPRISPTELALKASQRDHEQTLRQIVMLESLRAFKAALIEIDRDRKFQERCREERARELSTIGATDSYHDKATKRIALEKLRFRKKMNPKDMNEPFAQLASHRHGAAIVKKVERQMELNRLGRKLTEKKKQASPDENAALSQLFVKRKAVDPERISKYKVYVAPEKRKLRTSQCEDINKMLSGKLQRMQHGAGAPLTKPATASKEQGLIGKLPENACYSSSFDAVKNLFNARVSSSVSGAGFFRRSEVIKPKSQPTSPSMSASR